MKSIDLRVIVESPYRPNPHRYDLEMELQENLEYARRCMSHSIGMGESPFLSHLLYTQVLDDKRSEEREMGMFLARSWYDVADMCAVYTDKGVSEGMKKGIEYARYVGIPVEERSLYEGEDDFG